MCFAANVDFIALHDLLNGITDVAQSHVNARFLYHDEDKHVAPAKGPHPNASVRRIPDRIQQTVPSWLEIHGEGGIDNSAVNMHAKIHLHHIPLVQHLVRTSASDRFLAQE